MTEDEIVFEEPLAPSALRDFLNAPRWGLIPTLSWIITRDPAFACRASIEGAGYGKAGRWLSLDKAWKKDVRREFANLDQAWIKALAPALTKGTVTAIAARALFSGVGGRQAEFTGLVFPPPERPALAETCRLQDVSDEAFLFSEGSYKADDWEGWHQIAVSSDEARSHWQGSGPLEAWQSEKVVAEKTATPLEKARVAFTTFVKAWPAGNLSYPNKEQDIAWMRANVPEAAAIGNTRLAALRRDVLEANGHDQFQSAWMRQGRRK